MENENERLIKLVVEAFPGFTLATSRAKEWLDDFGFETCERVIDGCKGKALSNPTSYIYTILKGGGSKSPKSIPKQGLDPALQMRYEGFVAEGTLTGEELQILVSVRTGGKVGEDELLRVEYRLRRAVYPNSRNWIPTAMGQWERQVWRVLSEEERLLFSPRDLRDRGLLLSRKWKSSDEYLRMSKGDVSQVLDQVVDDLSVR